MARWAFGVSVTHMLATLCSSKSLLGPCPQSKALCSTMLCHGYVRVACSVKMVCLECRDIVPELQE